jgi:Amt family ammonium transporter
METNSGDTAWILTSSALVLLMTPGLALFYGGMVRRKNVLSTIMHSMAAIPILSVVWAVLGYSIAFGTDIGGFMGGFDYVGLYGLENEASDSIPTLVFAGFQMMFFVITPALISGAFAERMKFGAYVIFIILWGLLVYAPVCHWVWGGGWLGPDGPFHALDFAGGTVVHMTAGISALVCALVIGKRSWWPNEPPIPHNMTMTLIGAALLWFGWFGFNSGSALSSGGNAGMAFMTTHLGASMGALGWLVVESMHRGKPTALGIASGLVAGLVAITPAAGFVEPWAALIIGFAAGIGCYGAVLLKSKLLYDDSLDAFGVHGVGGFIGAILTGVLATVGAEGLIAGNPGQVVNQLVGAIAAMAYAAVLTAVILYVIKATVGLRVSKQEESEGLDVILHGEKGYADM